jgi:hypothetical protein
LRVRVRVRVRDRDRVRVRDRVRDRVRGGGPWARTPDCVGPRHGQARRNGGRSPRCTRRTCRSDRCPPRATPGTARKTSRCRVPGRPQPWARACPIKVTVRVGVGVRVRARARVGVGVGIGVGVRVRVYD